MPFTYEELRAAAANAMLGRGHFPHGRPNQFVGLKDAVAVTLVGTPAGSTGHGLGHAAQGLSSDDAELLREVFWDLFRQGYITLGINDNNASWPFYTLSRFGQKMLAEGRPYEFTDTTSFLAMVRGHVPDLDETTELYLSESVRAFHVGCILSSSVMLGVATEHRFDLLATSAASSMTHARSFEPVLRERLVLRRIAAFHKKLAPIAHTFPAEVREDLETHFTTIQAVIRASRNEAGHPTGKLPDREATYVHLQLFAPYGRKLWQLQQHLS